MKAITDFAFGVINGVESHRIGGHRSTALGRIQLIDTGEQTFVTPRQFPEVTLSVRDATVVYPNVVLTADGTLIDSNNGYNSSELASHHVPGFPLRKTDAGLAVDVPPASVEMENCVYLAAAANYSAFLLGELPRLELYAPFIEEGAPVVVHGELRPFHQDLLEMAGVDLGRVVSLPADTAIKAGRLIHATPTYLHNTTAYPALDFLREKLSPGRAAQGDGEKIYLSRSGLGPDADRRIANEGELEVFLAKRGFRIVHPQDITPREQIALFATASTIVSPFGAAWANAVFRRPGGRSLMLATKRTPDFAQIFQYIGEALSIIRLKAEKHRDGANFSKSHGFTVSETDFAQIAAFVG